jgi:hypothetical protein
MVTANAYGVVSPLWVLHPRRQATENRKYVEKIVSVLNMYRLYFLALLAKQYSTAPCISSALNEL